MCNFDPMQSWYMHHYGRGAAQATADAAQAAADGAAAAAEAVAEAMADAEAQQEAAAAADLAEANATGPDAASSQQAPPVSSANVARWWQDPAQVGLHAPRNWNAALILFRTVSGNLGLCMG